jgi:hypothetical protein
MTGVLDAVTERLGRYLAARSTRRSFLGRAGRTAVLVASGPTLAALLAERADARVCGQSGVAARCPTFDCTGPDHVWGWCWYASGDVCCAGGGLKKICDCCVTDYPNVHGYCPSGTNVMCLVESCAADPRVDTVVVDRLGGDASAMSAGLSLRRFPTGSAPLVVLADLEDPFAPALGGPLAAATRSSYLVAPRGGLPATLREEIARLRSTAVVTVGTGLVGSATERELRALGLGVAPTGGGPDAVSLSLDIATRIRAANGSRRTFAVDSVPNASLPLVGAAAAATGHPVIVSAEAARQAAFHGPGGPAVVTYLVGPAVAAQAGNVPGGNPIWSTSAEVLASDLAWIALVVEGTRPRPVVVLGQPEVRLAAGLTAAGGPIVLHRAGTLDPPTQVLLAQVRRGVDRAYWAGNEGVDGDFLYHLQGTLSGYDTHRLQGVPGEGLPVISQPPGERELGRARVSGVPVPMEDGSYWVGRLNPARDGG